MGRHMEQIALLALPKAYEGESDDFSLLSDEEASAHVNERIVSIYESCKDPDLRKRPKYKDVCDVINSLSNLNSKPAGTRDLEKELKRFETWMRKGKKLFGMITKTEPYPYTLQHYLTHVMTQNNYCFDLTDKPSIPVEPSSRSPTPDDSHTIVDRPSRQTFCFCRRVETGQMIECEVCHEWYHTRCLGLARGEIKEDDHFTCSICDWRVKIHRYAPRPKLEDLEDWQAEISQLPFQPEEEDILEKIVSTARTFRDFMRLYTKPLTTTPEEVTTQRFYLRKIEGAEVLLAFETNFLRQELHKWAPVADSPPPVLE